MREVYAARPCCGCWSDFNRGATPAVICPQWGHFFLCEDSGGATGGPRAALPKAKRCAWGAVSMLRYGVGFLPFAFWSWGRRRGGGCCMRQNGFAEDDGPESPAAASFSEADVDSHMGENHVHALLQTSLLVIIMRASRPAHPTAVTRCLFVCLGYPWLTPMPHANLSISSDRASMPSACTSRSTSPLAAWARRAAEARAVHHGRRQRLVAADNRRPPRRLACGGLLKQNASEISTVETVEMLWVLLYM
jgi:hypothetical protein